jgi:hypothetical protein
LRLGKRKQIIASPEEVMAVEYRHTQPGYLTAGTLGTALFFTAKQMLKGGPAALAVLPAVALLGGAAVFFSSLTVEIRDGVLRSYFGPGLPAKSVKVHDIESAEVVENPWYAGWGIRMMPRGTLYNVSGFQAVEVRMTNGSRFRLGTDEPETLREAILRAVEQAESGAE